MIAIPPFAGSPKNRVPWLAGGRVLMVKDAIEPSGSVALNPVTGVLLFGEVLKLVLAATGGWLGVGSKAATVAVAGLIVPLLSVAL